MFREELPEDCPPDTASHLEPINLLRLVGPHEVCDDDFRSQSALGYHCPSNVDECEWKSCSMFLPSYEKHKLIGLTRFKRLKSKTAVAYVAVDNSAGVGIVAQSKHVDLWMYCNFDPVAAVAEVKGLDDYEPA